jgi:hypothetical protein
MLQDTVQSSGDSSSVTHLNAKANGASSKKALTMDFESWVPVEEQLQYSLNHGQVYAHSKSSVDNAKMRTFAFAKFRSRSTVNVFMEMEKRFAYRHDKHYGFLEPCDALVRINTGKDIGKDGYQEALLLACQINDPRTFRKHFEKIGVRYESSTAHRNAKMDGVEFLAPNSDGEMEEYLYCSYHHRTEYRLEFIRNDALASSIINNWRKLAGASFNVGLLNGSVALAKKADVLASTLVFE